MGAFSMVLIIDCGRSQFPTQTGDGKPRLKGKELCSDASFRGGLFGAVEELLLKFANLCKVLFHAVEHLAPFPKDFLNIRSGLRR